MKNIERILSEHLAEFRGHSYQSLALMTGQVITRSAPPHQIEIQIFWDDEPGGAIRIIGCIDDGSLIRSIFPITKSLLIESTGNA